ncbi:MAG TPA: hypothetical protein DEF79_05425 [Gammaproteobacteria bacterium]|nr:hypothetical protein [Gammaproteobacteria bacterium]|tara:strand:- start:920 stop:1159 length:240 start_codon:yes stop_codon:yes gene_type:complete
MNKFFAVLQLLLAVLIAFAAVATFVNLVLISTRPETISVVAAMIGQGLLIICLAALARVLGRKAWRALSGESSSIHNPK